MTNGIHHITAIASDASRNIRFYTKILCLRLVKKSVNQDDTQTYHLFFGDRLGNPGMDLTFFIFRPPVQGRRGNGLVTNISLAVPEGSLIFWRDRFDKYDVKQTDIGERFGRRRILFYDEDDQQLELAEVSKDELAESDVWTTDDITEETAIRYFYSATLSVVSRETIEPALTHVFGYQISGSKGNVSFYEASDSMRGGLIEVSEYPDSAAGLNAAGTVHHIAFRAADEKEQLDMRDKAAELGLFPTHVIDRYYFKSVYFRTPSGILFEIATDGPGFTTDEKEDELGEKLALPPFLEKEREQIEANLPSIEIK